jgi:CBS domain-containing protein
MMTVANILKVKGFAVAMIKPGESIKAFAEQLKYARAGAMIVSDDGKTIDGIISERDLAYGLATHDEKLLRMKVSEIMTKSVISCAPNDSVADVMDLMTQRRIRHLPVKDGEKLIGMIDIGDVVKFHLSERLMAVTRR